ncbi:MAG TPA: sigma-70 family RNA polymerase sigma factor [Candidatus Krumholzibacterium sp.]|nr:sigma-70 family RNA polymerase sigma factor [Candidatus Krumholzibacterium sp.]
MEAFRLIVERMNRPLLAIAYRYCLDWDQAGDLCQETWLRVYQRSSTYDPARSFRNWLLTVHRNVCVSHLRLAARRRTLCENGAAGSISGPSGPEDPSIGVEKAEFAARIRGAVSRLTDMQRTVFSCVDLEQRSPGEACAILGMNPSTLRVTLHNARKRLASILRKTEEKD